MKIVILLVSLFLFGCESALKNVDNVTNAVIANDIVMSGQAAKVIKSVPLTDIEIAIVDHAFNAYGNFVDKWKDSVTSLDPSTETFAVFIIDFELVVLQYKSVEKIVVNKWDSYSSLNKVLLADYQNRAKKVYNSVDDTVAAGRRHQAMLDGVTFIKILAGVATSL